MYHITRSTSASLSFKGHVTKHTTVKRSIVAFSLQTDWFGQAVLAKGKFSYPVRFKIEGLPLMAMCL